MLSLVGGIKQLMAVGRKNKGDLRAYIDPL